LDDLLVSSETFDAHLGHLRQVFQRLRDNHLHLKPSKCFFARREVEFLGHIVGADGLRMNAAKIEKIINFPQPKSVKELRGFLGMAGWYRKFSKDFGKLAAPLTNLTRPSVPYVWSDECEQSFNLLKKTVSSQPVLAFPDFEAAKHGRPFQVSTDGSKSGIGAVLEQKGLDGKIHPLYFFSQQCNQAEQNFTTTDVEALAVVRALKKFRHFLLGYKFLVITDHQALTWMFQGGGSKRITKWCTELQDFTFDIIYRKGTLNPVADFLSRMHEGQ
jgi:hypothetical protein